MITAKKIKTRFRRILRVNKLKRKYSKITPTPLQVINRTPLFFNSSSTPKVSIIIPFYNEEIYTWNCLSFLNKHLTNEISFEILLIDDCSTDNIDFSLVNGITIHQNTENLGFLKNINKGIRLAKGEYIYILNNDTEVQENFLKELFYVFENFKNVGAVGSKLINPDKSLQEAGSIFMKDGNISQIVKKKKTFFPEVNYITKVDYCSGCSLLFKKNDDYGNLNLFDEQFTPAYFEETDLCFNLKYLQKKEIYYTPFSEVVHYNGISYNSINTDESTNATKIALFESNLEKFKKKWNKELEEIKATTAEDRMQEKYGNKSAVFFTKTIPEHDQSSGSNRLKELMTAFLELDYHVTLVCQNVCADNTYVTFYQKLGINVFYEHKNFSGFEKYLIDQKLKTSIYWFYGPAEFIEHYSTCKRISPEAKMIYDMVDIHHLRFQRALEFEPNKLSLRKKIVKYKKLESKAAELADYVITISEFEQEFMKSICDEKKILTISNIHYTKINRDETLSFEDRKGILFIGSTHTPNIDAIYYLYNEIMPEIWKELPDLKVNIIGNVNTLIKDIVHPNFIFHGFINCVDEYFKSNKLMIAPLRYGAGVKGKIGQSFEYFLPLVSSSVGTEGMKIINNENALIEDTYKGFAKSVVNLYSNKELWTKLQNNSDTSLQPFSKGRLKEQILKISS